MKNLLFGLSMVAGVLSTGCSTLGQSGAFYRDSVLGNPSPAPAKLSPPDYTPDAKSPLLDDTYLTSQADYHFTMGETLSYEGQSPRAIEEFKLTLIYDPKSIHVRLRLASEYVRMGMITEAVEQAEIAVEMAPTSVEARMLLGGLYSGLKMFGPARDQFDAVLKVDPENAEAAVYLGALLAEERKYDESIKYFEGLSRNKNFKDSERAWYYIGRVRAEQGQAFYGEAEKAFSRALKEKPEYPEAALALSMLVRAQGRDKEMEQILRSYQEKFGPEREMARQLVRHYQEAEDLPKMLEQLEILDGFERDNVNIKIQIALILLDQKRYEAAAQRLEDVLQLMPESSQVRFYLGWAYEELERPALAIEHFRKVTPGEKYFTDAVMHTANLYKKTGNQSKAMEHVEWALKAYDEDPQLYAFYTTLLDEQKQFRKAIALLNKAVDRFPTSTQLRFFLGTMHDRVGEPTKTIEHMKKVIEQESDHVQALNYLAYTYAELNRNLDEATALAKRALELQPGDGYILDTVGWILFKSGDSEQAIKYLEAAYKAKSDEAIIAEHLGDAYLRHQMWQKAQKMYMRAAQLEGDGERSAKIAEKIANLKTQNQGATRVPASVPQRSE